MGEPGPWHRLLRSARFVVRTREEAGELASVLAVLLPEPTLAELALGELLLNAIEHGNLGIGGALKAQLLRRGDLEDEIADRLRRSPCRDRTVLVDVAFEEGRVAIAICDQGDGFDWSSAASAPIEPSMAPNGRGLQIVRALSCAEVEWNDRGNHVTVRARR